MAASDEALYLAGEVFSAYRRNKGSGKKDGVLPEFVIGAVAQVEDLALVTFNEKDFVTRFPHLEIVVPA